MVFCPGHLHHLQRNQLRSLEEHFASTGVSISVAATRPRQSKVFLPLGSVNQDIMQMEMKDLIVWNLIPPRVWSRTIKKMTVKKRLTVKNSTTTISGFPFSSYFKVCSSCFRTPSGHSWREGKWPPYQLPSQQQTSKTIN